MYPRHHKKKYFDNAAIVSNISLDLTRLKSANQETFFDSSANEGYIIYPRTYQDKKLKNAHTRKLNILRICR